ncbi:MAG: hypothetical protein ACPG7F_00245 [Aggregatilineales bacterium]
MSETPTTDHACPACGGNLVFYCYVWNPVYCEPCFECVECGDDISFTELYYDEAQ